LRILHADTLTRLFNESAHVPQTFLDALRKTKKSPPYCVKKKYMVKYAVNDDCSVMAMVKSGFGITIFPEMLWSNYKTCDELEIRPMKPEQHRIIGLAALPPEENSVLAKVFLKFMRTR